MSLLRRAVPAEQSQLAAGVEQIGVGLDAARLGSEGVAVSLDQLELRADARAVAGARHLCGAGGDRGLRARRAAAHDIGLDAAPGTKDPVAGAEPDRLFSRARRLRVGSARTDRGQA